MKTIQCPTCNHIVKSCSLAAIRSVAVATSNSSHLVIRLDKSEYDAADSIESSTNPASRTRVGAADLIYSSTKTTRTTSTIETSVGDAGLNPAAPTQQPGRLGSDNR